MTQSTSYFVLVIILAAAVLGCRGADSPRIHPLTEPNGGSLAHGPLGCPNGGDCSVTGSSGSLALHPFGEPNGATLAHGSLLTPGGVLLAHGPFLTPNGFTSARPMPC